MLEFLCIVGFAYLASTILFGILAAIIKEFIWTGWFGIGFLLAFINGYVADIGERDGRGTKLIIEMCAAVDGGILLLILLCAIFSILDARKK